MAFFILFMALTACAADLADLPPNTWLSVNSQFSFLDSFQTGDADFRGESRLRYNPLDSQYLYYSGYYDTVLTIPRIYYEGNTLYSFNTLTDTSSMLSTSNWRSTSPFTVWYNPESLTHPKPMDRQTSGSFMFCDFNNTTYLGYGYSIQSKKSHDIWAFNNTTQRWRQLNDSAVTRFSQQTFNDLHMMYFPGDTTLYQIVRTDFGLRLFKINLKTDSISFYAYTSTPTKTLLWNAVGTVDTLRRRYVFYSGSDFFASSNLYAFYPDSAKISPLALSGFGPSPRLDPGFAYDAKNDLYFLTGGKTQDGTFFYDDSWIFDPKTNQWSEVNLANPLPGLSCFLLYDYARQLIVGLSGNNQNKMTFHFLDFNPAASGLQPYDESAGISSTVKAIPNPFNGSVRLSFKTPLRSNASLRIYAVSGRRIRTFQTGAVEPGDHHYFWDGTGDDGRSVPPGVYSVRLTLDNGSTSTHKLILSSH